MLSLLIASLLLAVAGYFWWAAGSAEDRFRRKMSKRVARIEKVVLSKREQSELLLTLSQFWRR